MTRSSADAVDVRMQSGPICALRPVITEEPLPAQNGGSARALADLSHRQRSYRQGAPARACDRSGRAGEAGLAACAWAVAGGLVSVVVA
jgi:hypothetical protein